MESRNRSTYNGSEKDELEDLCEKIGGNTNK